jgi:hypothetical protein
MAPELLCRGHSCFASEFSQQYVACQLVRRIARALVRNYISCGVQSRVSRLVRFKQWCSTPALREKTCRNQYNRSDDQNNETKQRQLRTSHQRSLITSGFPDTQTLVDVASIEG